MRRGHDKNTLHTIRSATARYGAVGCALGLLLAASDGVAQEIRGVVVLSGSGSPIAGALVSAVAADGHRTALSVSDREGHFVLASAQGAATLRVDAIGRRAATAAVPATGEARVELPRESIDLAKAVASAPARCEVQPGPDRPAGLLLSEARKALAIESWTRARHLFLYDVFQYQRRLGPGDRIEGEQGRQLQGLAESPSRSRSPDQVALEGYAQSTPRGDVLFAPDANVLLSDQFASGHCFGVRLEPAQHGHASRVGITFEPVAGRKAVDIFGVMWLDAETAELSDVDFAYSGLAARGPRAPAGGLSFQRLSNGLWTLGRWWVRTPPPPSAEPPLAREDGAEVMRVALTDGSVLPVISRAHLLGVVNSVKGGVPIEGARVRLIGTNYEATTNPDGRFYIPELPAGRFRVGVAPGPTANVVPLTHDVWLAGNQTTQVEIDLADSARALQSANMQLSAADSLRYFLRSAGIVTTQRVDSLINDALTTHEPGKLVGRVFDRSTGRAVPGAEVVLTGTEHHAITGSDGRFRIGDVPSGSYVVETHMLGFEARADTVSVPAGLVIDAEVGLATQAIKLDPITVTVRSRWLDQNGFFDRRTSGLSGHFFTRRDIEEKHPALFTDLLRDIPGVFVLTNEVGTSQVRFRRVTTIINANDELRGCEPGVYYDGVPLNSGWDQMHNIPIPFIDGIEVYVGAATPIEYKNSCGVILIWTRRPR